MQRQYERLMRKCIALAKKSEGHVSPNPLVGAIIFDDNFRIIAQGRHERYGQNHAERNAILSAKEDLKGKSIIVNLEPCSHFGKTPPCADFIIEKGIKRVIIGMVDPNPIVSGNGIKKLHDAGIEVITGILEDECKELNEIFIKNQLYSKPFITIKTATTLDGKTATRDGNSKWITDETSRKEVHKLRNKYDAILTGSNTVIKDNPTMTCRIRGGRNPVRIVLDTNLKTDPMSKIYDNDGTKVIIITSEKTSKQKESRYPSNVKIIRCPQLQGQIDINKAIELIYQEGIRSILVEAGAKINNSIIQSKSADKLIQFIAPKILSDKDAASFSQGCVRSQIAECNNLIFLSTKKLKNDIMVIGKFIS